MPNFSVKAGIDAQLAVALIFCLKLTVFYRMCNSLSGKLSQL